MKRREGWGVSVCVHALGYPLALLGSIGVVTVQHCLLTRCTKCRFVLERIDGCDHMTCRCGAEFCFQCGTMPHCGFTCKKKKNLDDEA